MFQPTFSALFAITALTVIGSNTALAQNPVISEKYAEIKRACELTDTDYEAIDWAKLGQPSPVDLPVEKIDALVAPLYATQGCSTADCGGESRRRRCIYEYDYAREPIRDQNVVCDPEKRAIVCSAVLDLLNSVVTGRCTHAGCIAKLPICPMTAAWSENIRSLRGSRQQVADYCAHYNDGSIWHPDQLEDQLDCATRLLGLLKSKVYDVACTRQK